MPEATAQYLPADYMPIVIQFCVALGFVTVTMILTHILGSKSKTEHKADPFECGVESPGDARTPFSIKYFLTAILFVLFDVEVVFMYPWAVNFRALGVLGFLEMMLFLCFLLLGFYYVVKRRALDWD